MRQPGPSSASHRAEATAREVRMAPMTGALAPGKDKWTALHPECQWRFQLEYAAEIGLGSLNYKLIWLPEVNGVK